MATYYVDTVAGADTNAGTSAGSGNAFATITKAAGVVAAGDKVWIKASGSYFEAPPITTTAGTSPLPIAWEGYTATIGDGGKATIDAQNTRAACMTVSKNFNTFKNFIFTGATTRCIDNTAAVTQALWINCQFLKGAGSATLGWDSSTFNVISTHCINCLWNGFTTNALTRANGAFYACEFKACGGIAAAAYSTGFCLFRCLIWGGAGPAINIGSSSSTFLIDSCTIQGKTSGSAILFSGTGSINCRVTNCILAGNAAYGLDAPVEAGIYAGNNAYYNNTSGSYHTTTAGTGDVTITSDPFISSATGNFALNNVAGGGASLRAAGFPGVYPGGTTTGSPDIGGVQHADPAAVVINHPVRGRLGNIYGA